MKKMTKKEAAQHAANLARAPKEITFTSKRAWRSGEGEERGVHSYVVRAVLTGVKPKAAKEAA